MRCKDTSRTDSATTDSYLPSLRDEDFSAEYSRQQMAYWSRNSDFQLFQLDSNKFTDCSLAAEIGACEGCCLHHTHSLWQ